MIEILIKYQKMQREYNQIGRLIDFCQQCECYHKVIIKDAQFLIGPCENKIYQQLAKDQKISTETNVTSRHTETNITSRQTETNITSRQSHALSINSLSSLSIRNHLQPSNKPNINKTPTKQTIYSSSQSINSQSIIISQSNSSKSKPNQIYLNKQRLSPSKINIHDITTPNKVANRYKQQLRTTSPSQKQNINNNTSIQNISIHQISPYPVNHKNLIIETRPQIPQNNLFLSSSIQTPQFGSQSLVTQNKQNNQISKRRKNIKKSIQKQTKSKNQITQNIIQINNSLVQEHQLFCCGYLKKC